MKTSRLFAEGDRKIWTRSCAGVVESYDITCGIRPELLAPGQLEAAVALLQRSPLAIGRARRIAVCPPLTGPREPIWRRACRQRACPLCAERRGRRLASQMMARAAAYADARAVLVTCPSKTLLDLPEALQCFRAGFGKLRRRRWFATCVRGGTLAIETPLTRDGRRWALHAHGVVDVTGRADEAWKGKVASTWVELTAIPGAVFEFEPLRSGRALVRYALKLGDTKSWAPGGNDLPAGRRIHLDRAIRGRRLVIAWGPRRAAP